MVINDVVEGAVDPFVDVQGLKVVTPAFTRVDLGHDAGEALTKNLPGSAMNLE